MFKYKCGDNVKLKSKKEIGDINVIWLKNIKNIIDDLNNKKDISTKINFYESHFMNPYKKWALDLNDEKFNNMVDFYNNNKLTVESCGLNLYNDLFYDIIINNNDKQLFRILCCYFE
jgi:predicted MPP superfamily phosphohydrolase